MVIFMEAVAKWMKLLTCEKDVLTHSMFAVNSRGHAEAFSHRPLLFSCVLDPAPNRDYLEFSCWNLEHFGCLVHLDRDATQE